MKAWIVFLQFHVMLLECVKKDCFRTLSNRDIELFCCDNKIEVNHSCLECPDGYMAEKSHKCIPCQHDFWGRKYALRCHCGRTERCDVNVECVEAEIILTTDSKSKINLALTEAVGPNAVSDQPETQIAHGLMIYTISVGVLVVVIGLCARFRHFQNKCCHNKLFTQSNTIV